MKTFVPFKNSLLVASLVIAAQFASADTKPADHLVFNNPKLKSGTDLKLGAVYQFKNVMSGVDALVSIDSLVGGASVSILDDNSGGLGYSDAFQPAVTIPGDSKGKLHEAYAVFTITFYNNTTNAITTLQSVGATALDIDGNATLKELAEINMAGGSASFMSTSLDIAVTNLLGLLSKVKYRADNILGIERDGIDTSALGNMFSVSNTNISSFKIKYGAKSTMTTSTARQYSLYMKGFQYPNQVTLPVKLENFSAKYNQSDVTLTWKSATETDFNYYQLEQSSDGEVFTTTSVIFGAATNGSGADYSYVDRSVEGRGGLIYYRLKMVDIDGNFTYSAVRIVRLGEEKSTMTLSTYPNPVVNDLRITLPISWQNKQLNIDVYNANGQHVNTLKVENSSQTESISVASLQRGVYFVKVNCGLETATQQIIKN
jgi:hypothetical protein